MTPAPSPRPCPFCGGEAGALCGAQVGPYPCVWCDTCSAAISSSSLEEAIAIWNRLTDPTTAALVEALRKSRLVLASVTAANHDDHLAMLDALNECDHALTAWKDLTNGR